MNPGTQIARSTASAPGHRSLTALCLAPAAFLTLVAVWGGCGTEPPVMPEVLRTIPPPANVEESLNALGVNTTPTPRVDENGDPLPDNYAPVDQDDLVPNDELFLAGLMLENASSRLAFVEQMGVEIDENGDIDPGATSQLATPSDADHPWAAGGASTDPQTLRAVAAGDIDDDGFEEIVAVYLDGSSVKLEVLQDKAASFAASNPVAIANGMNDVQDLAVAAGDFDGDGVAEIVVGVSESNSAKLWFLNGAAQGFQVQSSLTKTLSPSIQGSRLFLILEAGNIDMDHPQELVVVFNELDESFSPPDGATRYFIYDDANSGLAALDQGPIQDAAGNQTAIVADSAVGDIDRDGTNEIVFGGLTEFFTDCRAYGHLYVALDDAAHGLAPLGDRFMDIFEPECSAVSPLKMRFVHVNTLDLDGDGVDEIQANKLIFEDFAQAAEDFGEADAAWATIYSLPKSEILSPSQSTSGGTYGRTTSSIVTGDVTGDGREDIISFVQWNSEINVYGLPMIETFGFSKWATLETEGYNAQSNVKPIIMPVNVDTDSLRLRYSEGEYRFVFTEPIIVAALAAAPCISGAGQNTDACVTSYGLSESTQIGADGTVTVRASTSVGGEVEIFGIGASVRETVSQSASFSAGLAYTLEESVEYTTGPVEDTVVFTTVPLDLYTYSVVSHPDPDQIGKQIVIRLPRSPITLQVERQFYNDHVVEGAFLVGSNVFLHTPGNLDSYPTEADADVLIDTGGLGHLGPLGEIVDAVGEAIGPVAEHLLGRGLKSSRATTVGQGSGQTTTEIRFSQQTDYRAGAEISYDIEAETTVVGVVVGGSVGGSVEAGISWGTGSSTIYRGTVGSIDAANFSANVYSFGLFTYIYNYGDPTQPQFEVINYYVAR